MFGIASAPARTITSEQTDARTGRRLNVSTNMTRLARNDRRAVAELLDVRDDHPVAGGESPLHDVVVADDGADGDRLLPGHEALDALLGDEDEVLPGDPADGDDRDGQRRVVA